MSEFDPNDATVKQVEEHLEGASAEEIARVREIEEAGQNRSSIHWPDSEPAPAPDEVVEAEAQTEEGDGSDDAPVDPRPVWNVETHGKPTPAQREFYRVIGE